MRNLQDILDSNTVKLQTVNILSDIDDDIDMNFDNISVKTINNNIDAVDTIRKNVRQIIIDYCEDEDSVLKYKLKYAKDLINNPNNYQHFANLITVNDYSEFRNYIIAGMKLFGNNGNFNWMDITPITDLANMFHGISMFDGHIELWDTSQVNDMSYLFANTIFNQDISGWDVSNVENMDGMFSENEYFNQPIGKWNTCSVINMADMFCSAGRFNQPIGNWDTAKVSNMSGMFENAYSFNQPINNWNVSRVTTMAQMFHNAMSFNQPLNNWDVSNVENMRSMFMDAVKFNQDLNNWNVRKVTPAYTIFAKAISFNFDNIANWKKINYAVYNKAYQYAYNLRENTLNILSDIDTGGIDINITTKSINQNMLATDVYIRSFKRALETGVISDTLKQIFNDKKNFEKFYGIITPRTKYQLADICEAGIKILGNNANLNWIDTSKITDMKNLFNPPFFILSQFNGDISMWDVSNVTDMSWMFSHSSFNGNISNWDVSNVTHMRGMFNESKFNQDISNWDVSNVIDMNTMFYKSPFNKDLSKWNINPDCDVKMMIYYTVIKKAYKPRQNGKILPSNNSRYITENSVEILSDLDIDDDINNISITTKNINTSISSFQFYINEFIDAIENGKITNKLKHMVNSPKNFKNFKGIIKAKDSKHLKELISIGRVLLGNNSPSIEIPNEFNLNWIDTSLITDMNHLFAYDVTFNGHIELWDTSNVDNMAYMFHNAKKFNQPIGDWDTSNVMSMTHMFDNAEQFNQPIGKWDVGNVINMSYMFYYASSFNQPIGDWDTHNLTYIQYMFKSAVKFNQPIGNWNTNGVINMIETFFNAVKFNQNINNWDVSNVKYMEGLFYACSTFNQPLNQWDVSCVSSMKDMFKRCSNFNQPLNNWNTKNVKYITNMFSNTKFNQDISNWNLNNVINKNAVDRMFLFNDVMRDEYKPTIQ